MAESLNRSLTIRWRTVSSQDGSAVLMMMALLGAFGILVEMSPNQLHDSHGILLNSRVVDARNALVYQVNRYASMPTTLRQALSLSLPGNPNAALSSCVFGTGPAPCPAGIEQPVTLYLPVNEASPQLLSSPIGVLNGPAVARFDLDGEPCSSPVASFSCPFLVSSTFTATCPGGASSCSTAQSLVIHYEVVTTVNLTSLDRSSTGITVLPEVSQYAMAVPVSSILPSSAGNQSGPVAFTDLFSQGQSTTNSSSLPPQSSTSKTAPLAHAGSHVWTPPSGGGSFTHPGGSGQVSAYPHAMGGGSSHPEPGSGNGDPSSQGNGSPRAAWPGSTASTASTDSGAAGAAQAPPGGGWQRPQDSTLSGTGLSMPSSFPSAPSNSSASSSGPGGTPPSSGGHGTYFTGTSGGAGGGGGGAGGGGYPGWSPSQLGGNSVPQSNFGAGTPGGQNSAPMGGGPGGGFSTVTSTFTAAGGGGNPGGPLASQSIQSCGSLSCGMVNSF